MVTKAGVYGGQCAEFCGIGHAEMQFTVEAMDRPAFDAWVLQQQQSKPTAQPSAPPGAATVAVTAVGVLAGFDPKTLTAPANQPFVVNLTNADATVQHDFGIKGANPDGSDFKGDPDAPPSGSASYNIGPLPPKDYEFYCTIHPNMTGTLHVQ
jgi:heme/copper-type cytochrome/quinol oxidase subunit 2